MGKHARSEGHGGTLPEDQYIGEYRPVAVPNSGGCCCNASGELESKVDQIDRAYGDK